MRISDWSSDVCSSDLYALMSLAPKRLANFPQAVPDSAGIPARVRDEMLIAPFNDLETAAGLIREYHDELGGVIVEPFQRLLPPKPGFLEGLRALTNSEERRVGTEWGSTCRSRWWP